jgi:hypothetical protein
MDEAQKILNIFRFYKRDGKLYLDQNNEVLDDVFEAVVYAINDSGVLKTRLPQYEFVIPSKKFAMHESSWRGHFEERDNRRFFLSDVYDYLTLFFGSGKRAKTME